MSIEFFGDPVPLITDSTIATVITRLSQMDGYRPTRRTASVIGLVRASSAEGCTETITVKLAPSRVYVAFHFATRDEIDRFIGRVCEFLQDEHIACDLEED